MSKTVWSGASSCLDVICDEGCHKRWRWQCHLLSGAVIVGLLVSLCFDVGPIVEITIQTKIHFDWGAVVVKRRTIGTEEYFDGPEFKHGV